MIEQIPTFWSPIDLLMIVIWSFVCTTVAVVIFTPLAKQMKLVDNPDIRKQHAGAVPLVGGLAITLAVAFSLVVVGAFSHPSTQVLLIIGFILALLGMLDDYADISARYRLLVEIAVGVALCFYADLKITSVGDITGHGSVVFGGLSAVIFTIMCSVGVFNSINMIDGIDGLAGTVVSLSAGAMASIAFIGGDTYAVGVLLAVVTSVVAFLLFNLGILGSQRKVFLGDSGSMFLGFILLWFFIYLSQGDAALMSPVVAGWVFGLPLADTVAVIVGRIIRGESPLAAGRDHIHHRLLVRGFSARQVLVILSSYHFVLVLIGVICNSFPASEPFLFVGFVLLTIVHFFVLSALFPHNPLTARGKSETPELKN